MITFADNGILTMVPSDVNLIRDQILLSLDTPLGSFWQRLDFGSELYKLRRAKATTDLPTKAEGYATAAVAWMITAEILTSVSASASWQDRAAGRMRLVTTAKRGTDTIEVPYWVPVPGDPR
jgi:phage gp46-like protein